MEYVKYTKIKPNKILIGEDEHKYTDKLPDTVFYETGPNIDPVLENNEWSVIKQVCQSGQAANYWALGDEKIIAVTESGTTYQVPHAIVDMTANRYDYTSDNTKKTQVVFQSVPMLLYEVFNSSSNVSPNGDTAYNGWGYSELRTKMNSGSVYNAYDSSFTALLEQVNTKCAYSGLTNELTASADKLFLPASKEAFSNPSYTQSCESSLTEFGFYAQNSDADANRIKLRIDDNQAHVWWLRSPLAGHGGLVLNVYGGGSLSSDVAYGSRGVAPCFAW